MGELAGAAIVSKEIAAGAVLTTGMDNRARPGMAWISLYRSKFLDCLAGAVQ